MPYFAKSCQKSCAGPSTKCSIFTCRGAKKSSSEKIDGNSQCRWQKGLMKSTIFFPVHIKNTISLSWILQLNFSCTRLNDWIPLTFHEQSDPAQVRYSKTSERLSSIFEDQYTFWKCRSFTVYREKIVWIFFVPRKIWWKYVKVSTSPKISFENK